MNSAELKALGDDDWLELRRHFQIVLALDLPARADYLSSLTSKTVRAQVSSLLRFHEESGSFLDHPVVRLPSPDKLEPWEPPPAASVGDRIGPWKITEEIGHGGMGAVYKAVRDDGAYTREVAIKLLQPLAVGREDMLWRFQQERQILADIEHPNIALLIDGGTTEDHQPYLVMEYVEGLTLTHFCERNDLPLGSRLDLFRTICDAVQSAHRRLVVHRDLKPGNVLVTADGVPKLLDFGIAKLLRPDRVGATDQTALGTRPMTLQYASPEQIQGRNISTATDVYSLGVLLYELLADTPPYQLHELSWYEAAGVICETEPPPPSIAVVHRKPRGGESAQAIKRLSRRLQVDLDQIVAKALHKEPDERYRSVEQLSEDVWRHQNGFPVAAHRGTIKYRAGKFVRRNWLGTMAMSALMAFAIVVTIMSTAINNERKRAEGEQAKAEAINQFLEETLGAPDPYDGTGLQVTVAEVLDTAAKEVQARFADQPEVASAVRFALGSVFRRLGLLEKAEHQLRHSLNARREQSAVDPRALAQTLNELSALLITKGAYHEARQAAEEALHIYQESNDDMTSVLDAKNHFAIAIDELGNSDHAEALYRQILNEARFIENSAPIRVATLDNLAQTEISRGNFKEAREFIFDALALLRNQDVGNHAKIAELNNSRAILRRQQGEYEMAEGIHMENISTNTKLLGREHPTVQRDLNNLGLLKLQQGAYEEARELLEEALDLAKKNYKKPHPHIANTLLNLASLEHEIGNYDASLSLNLEAMGVFRETYGDKHPAVANVMNNIGVFQHSQGRLREAEDYFRKAIEVDSYLLGGESMQVASIKNNLGAALADMGEYEEAAALFRSALTVHQRLLGQEHHRVAASLDFLATTLQSQGRLDQAEAKARHALRIRQGAWPDGHLEVVLSLNNLGSIMKDRGNLLEAEGLYQEAFSQANAMLGAESPYTIMISASLAHITCRRGRIDEALKIFERAVSGLRQYFEEEHPRVALATGDRGGCLVRAGRHADAEAQLRPALASLTKTFGDEHEYTQRISGYIQQLEATRASN